ncbi:DM13 domain-containing protein [Deinococcus oregonensis]|uniref:DM13 domain-containing protein n=1 Tax=Deinococcus oregonensis TaxID=1805970 RepID=A0ABV6AVV9_9DEIO
MPQFQTKTTLPTLARLALTALILLPVASAQPTAGTFHSLAAPTTGTAVLVKQGGNTTLQLKNLKTEPGPDLQVWLYRNAAPLKGAKDATIAKGKYIKVGTLKTFNGSFSYVIPKGTDVTQYKSVVIWCDQVKTAFAAAALQ